MMRMNQPGQSGGAAAPGTAPTAPVGMGGPVHAALGPSAPSPTPGRPVMGVNRGEIGVPWNFRFSK